MLIALDYDDTYTRDRKFWVTFIANATGAGHRVICVTARTSAEAELMDQIFKELVPVYPTSREQKRPFMQRQGIFVDVWIDDQPEWIVERDGVGDVA